MTATLTDRSFGEELRRWRAQRRVSQLELAILAGTTQRHLSFVERGRSLPGRAMVVRLAESLDLPLRERNALLMRAGYAPAYPESTLEDPDLHAVREALEGVLRGHEPYPAMVVDRAGELISANNASEVFFEDVAVQLLAQPLNTRRLALHPEGLAPRIANFERWAPHITDSLRRELSRNPDPALSDLLDELETYLPGSAISANHLGFAVPMVLTTDQGPLRLITTLMTFSTSTDVVLTDIRLEAFLPADDQTAGLLYERAARTPPSRIVGHDDLSRGVPPSR